MTMEEKIWLYPELSPEERREVAAYVEEHSHLKERLAQAKRLWHVIGEGQAIKEDPPRSDAIAFLAVMGDVDAARMPASLREAVAELRARVEADPELHARYDVMRRRREELEAASDVSEQVRRLVGSVPGRAAGGPDEADRDSPIGADGRLTRTTHRRRRLHWTVPALLAVAALYALLYAAGQITRPASERLASFEESELVVEGYEGVRGTVEAGPVSEEAELYMEALTYLRSAETSFLGLFPRYDQARLGAAAERLDELLEREPAESFLADEARFLLGKTEIARGNLNAARAHLQPVAGAGGRHAGEARRLLRALNG